MQNVICCNIFNKNCDKMYHKIKKEGTLIELRNSLEMKRHFDLLYFLKSNGNYFSKEEEKSFIFKPSENSENLIINYTDVNKIKIHLDNKFLCDINFENIPLSNLRIQLGEKITPQHKFFFNDAFILDENIFKVFEICKNNVIEINKISNEIFNSLIKEEIFINKELNDSREINNIKRKNINNIENNDKIKKFNSFNNDKNVPNKSIVKNNINNK